MKKWMQHLSQQMVLTLCVPTRGHSGIPCRSEGHRRFCTARKQTHTFTGGRTEMTRAAIPRTQQDSQFTECFAVGAAERPPEMGKSISVTSETVFAADLAVMVSDAAQRNSISIPRRVRSKKLSVMRFSVQSCPPQPIISVSCPRLITVEPHLQLQLGTLGSHVYPKRMETD